MGRCYNPHIMKDEPEENYFYSQHIKSKFVDWYMVYEVGYTCQYITMRNYNITSSKRLSNKYKVSPCIYS